MQAYADRGVFRGFRATPLRRGRVEYQFLWLFRRPTHAVFDARRGVLAFASLVPGIETAPTLVDGLDAIVRSRTARNQPAHKRLDGRRARVSCAVRRALSLINDLFLSLHDAYPDYLIERFGLSAE